MPTERFRRLSAEKRMIIRKAAMKEFARVPFEKASINQIIQNAGISRGSFYTYFEDKQDLVSFLMEEINDELSEHCVRTLEENGGDYFAMMDGMLDHMLGMIDREWEWIEVARNVFNYQENLRGLGLETRLAEDFKSNSDKNLHQRIDAKMDHSLLREQDEEGRSTAITLGGIALLMALKRYYMSPEELEEARRSYRRCLEVIKYGALRERPAS
ncbi:MAG: TetR/AcrR family transcriptional regulator [Clostridiales bacterium]|nr:TetR/AcrR family transcriptional regulator [Clostridiales bacterium]